MKVKILTPQIKIFEGEAREIVLPGEDGEFSVLDFHQPCIYSLRQGRIKIGFKDKKLEKQKIFIKKGIARVGLDTLDVLVEAF
jgi:F-type H+-transporting ATPase subunit epsilon